MIRPVALAAFSVVSAFAVAPVAAAAPFSAAAEPITTTIPEVSLDVERCPSLLRDEVLRLAALELDAPVLPVAAAGQHTTRVEVACSGNSVQLRVSDPLTGKQLMRSMTLNARETMVATRLVALAVSELVITSWMELTLTHGSADAAATTGSASGGAPSLELRRAAEELAERRSQRRPVDTGTQPPQDAGYILALAQATGPFSGVGLGYGGGLRLGWTSGRGWPAASVAPEQGTAEVRSDKEAVAVHPAADVDVSATWADVSKAFGDVAISTWSVAPRLGIKMRRGAVWLELGLGGRVGLARVVGTPLDPANTRGGTSIGTWWGPAGHLGLGVQWGRLVVVAGLESGRVLRHVAGVVDGDDDVSVTGNWLAGTLAMGWGR